MDQFQSPNSTSPPQDLRAGFGHDASASLEVSLVVEAQSDFRLTAAQSPTPGEVHDSSFGHNNEEVDAAEDGLQAQQELPGHNGEMVLTDSVMNVVEYADKDKDLEDEAFTETRGDREHDYLLIEKGEASVEGHAQSAGEDEAGTNRQAETTADILNEDVKEKSSESGKFEENMLESDEDQEGTTGILEEDDNDDHVAALGEARGGSIGAQVSGGEDDMTEILEAYEPAGIDEEQGALELDENDDNLADLEEGQDRAMGAQVSGDYDSMVGVLGADKPTGFDEEQEGRNEELEQDDNDDNVAALEGRNEELEQDDNDDNAAALEEGLGCSIGAQVSGDDDDMPGILGADKSGVSEEEKTGVSDEANTGTSEEKVGGAGLEKAGIAAKASQKRKSSSLAPATTNGQETGIKKAKKKPVNVWAKTSSRKGGKKSSKNGSQQNPAKEDCVLLTPVCRTLEKNDDGPNAAIVLSKVDKAEKVELSQDRLSAGSTKGYRMVRATRGVIEGTWYFEILVEKLGPTGHTRLGWSTQKGDVQAPVGFDTNSYAYRDVDGSKVHMAIRESYGELYVEGDVIGFYINLPRGAEFAPKPPPLVSYRGRPYLSEMKEEPPRIVPGSQISFFRNGVCQGVAFKDINAGRYYPAASMYTLPNEPNCTVRFNFGPEFKFPPIDIGERPPPQPMSSAPFCGFDGGQEPGPMAWGSESHAVNVNQTSELQKLGEAG